MAPNVSTLYICLVVFSTTTCAAETQTSTDVQQIFEEAIQQRENGKIYDAIELFETILTNQPSLGRARLELAVAYHEASRYQEALRQFQIVLDDPATPESVRLSILAYLGQLSHDALKPDNRNDISYFVKTGLIYNSNISVTPGKGQVLFPGLTDTSQGEISSTGIDLNISASHRYSQKSPLNIAGAATHFEWLNQASLMANIYEKTGDYDLYIASIGTGPALISPGRWRALADFRVDQILLDSSQLATFVSLSPAVTFDFGGYRSLTLESSLTNHDYSKTVDAGRDGNESMIGAGYTTFLKNIKAGMEIGSRLVNNDADLDEFAYSSVEIYFGGFMTTAINSSIYLKINNKQLDYDGPDSISGIVRDETENHLAFGYNQDFTAGILSRWIFNAEISYTDNSSNINAFNFERTMATVNISRYLQ